MSLITASSRLTSSRYIIVSTSTLLWIPWTNSVNRIRRTDGYAVSCFGHSFFSHIAGAIRTDPSNPDTLERTNFSHPRGRWVLHRRDSCPPNHGQLPFRARTRRTLGFSIRKTMFGLGRRLKHGNRPRGVSSRERGTDWFHHDYGGTLLRCVNLMTD